MKKIFLVLMTFIIGLTMVSASDYRLEWKNQLDVNSTYTEVTETSDGGYVAVGYAITMQEIMPEEATYEEVALPIMSKYDKDGKLLWTKNIVKEVEVKETNNDVTYIMPLKVASLENNEYIILGNDNNTGESVILRYDKDGNLMYFKEIRRKIKYQKILDFKVVKNNIYITCNGNYIKLDLEGKLLAESYIYIITDSEENNYRIYNIGEETGTYSKIIKYNSEEKLEVEKNITFDDYDATDLWQIVVDDNITLYGVLINFNQSNSTDEYKYYEYVAQYDKDLNFKWQNIKELTDKNEISIVYGKRLTKIIYSNDDGYIKREISIEDYLKANNGELQDYPFSFVRYDKNGKKIEEYKSLDGHYYNNMIVNNKNGNIFVGGKIGFERSYPIGAERSTKPTQYSIKRLEADSIESSTNEVYPAFIEKYSNDYIIEKEETEQGKLEVNLTNAKAGTKVTFKASPKFGYKVAKVVVLDSNNNEIEVNMEDSSFIMPSSDVIVKVTYEAIIENPKTGVIDVSLIMLIVCGLSFVLYKSFKSKQISNL